MSSSARLYPLFVLALLVVGCSSDPEEDPAVVAERAEMQAKIDSLEQVVADLRDTPERRLLDARTHESAGRIDSAEAAYRSLVERYPTSEEAEEGRAVLARLEEERAAERAEAERRQRLQFLALPVERTVEVGPVEVSIRGVSIRDRWIFDRYDNRWHYRDARRGSKYVVAELTVTADADSHNPSLPPVVVYRVDGDRLQRVGVAEYRFYAWRDYGSYLGNYADYSNDFAHSSRIRFTAGIEVPSETTDEPLYVVVGKSGCVRRRSNDYGNPEVYYSESSCSPPQSLTVDQAEQSFEVIQRFNTG